MRDQKSKIKNIPRSIIFAFLLVIFNFSFLIFHLEKANAASLSLSIDPSLIEIQALPPSTAISALSIQNKSDNLVQLQILLKPFKARLENGELEYLNSDDPFVVRNVRILDGEVPIEGVTLGPGQQKDLTLTINIPQDTNVSDYYFSIIFISQSQVPYGTWQSTASPTSTTSSNQLGIVSNVLLSVGAKETPATVLEEFSTKLFYESGPVPFTVRIKNKGTHFIKPKGEILIKNMFGQSIGKLDLASLNILSDSIRAFSNDLNTDFKSPKALWKESFLLGFYTATLNISFSNDPTHFTKSINFFTFPFQGLIVIVIILIGVIIVAGKVKARMKK